VGKAFTKIKKTNLYDLFFLHAMARGRVVKTPAQADVQFLSYGPQPVQFDLAKIASEYMGNAVKEPVEA